MTKLISLVLIFVGTAFFSVSAQKRGDAQILGLAQKHFNSIGTRSFGSLTVIPASRILSPAATRRSSSDGEPFYLVASPGRMVIVSGDERMKDILGYSDNGSSDLSQLSPGFLAWLRMYADEYDYIQTHSSEDLKWRAYESNIRSVARSAVSPLLSGISWAQDAPYNQRCPDDNGKKSLTGCVATAMAQVMMYHKYPEYGQGSKTYFSHGINRELTLNLASEPLLWDKMQSVWTQEGANAVAWLMYCCGISIETHYTNWSSDSSSIKLIQALVTNFGYDTNIQYHMRAHYSANEWINLIKKDINEERPVICSAYSATAPGHCFVFDGYDKDNKIHVNWGWGGGQNGYYEITSMNPFALTGSIGGFNVDQSIATGIQRPQGAQPYVSHIAAPASGIVLNTTSIPRNGTFSVGENYYTNFGDAFSGSIQSALFQNGILTTLLGNPYIQEIPLLGSVKVGFDRLMIPGTVPNGEYDLCIVAKDNRESDWQIVKMSKEVSPSYKVSINNSGIEFKNPVNLAGLVVSSFEQEHNLYNGYGAKCKLVIRNDGTEWMGRIGVHLIPTKDASLKEVKLIEERVVFAVGDNQFDLYNDFFEAAPGEYKLVPSYSYYGTIWYPVNTDKEYLVTVYPKPQANSYKLELGELDFRSTLTDKDKFELSFNISNTGVGPFEGKFSVIIYNSSSSYVKEISQNVFLDTQKREDFLFSLNETVPDGEYLIRLNYYVPGLHGGTKKLTTEEFDLVVRTLFGNKK